MTTLPAQRLRMGSTTYFLSSISVKELVMVVRPASEAITDWDEMSVEDRMQREIKVKRLHDEIIPYLATHPDRFFGSVIVLIDQAEVSFETLEDLKVSLPNAYKGSMEKFGFLTINKGNWIALDGQHRLVALREIVLGRFEGKVQPGIPNDDVSVIFIVNEDIKKTRRIFNKVNRYARPTSRADNLILSEDDGYAIIARRLFTDPQGEWHSRDRSPQMRDRAGTEIVNWKNNTLSRRSTQLTTISALSLMVRDICKANGLNLDEKSTGGVVPDDRSIDIGYTLCQEWFAAMFDAFRQLDEARRDVSLIPLYRETLRPFSFLFKPAGQISLFRAALLMQRLHGDQFSIDEFMTRAAEKIDWALGAESWRNVIVLGGTRVLAKQNNYDDAALILVWRLEGSNLDTETIERARARWEAVNPGEPLPRPA